MKNDNDQQAVFKFKNISKLHNYLRIKKPNEGWIAFTLQAVLDIILSIIYKEKKICPTNPKIIICGPNLTIALNTPALHLNQLKEYVLKQLIYISPPQHLPHYKYKPKTEVLPSSPFDRTKYNLLPLHCTISRRLRQTFLTLPNFPKHQYTLTYSQICSFISSYIITNQHRFIDNRNKYLCIINNDVLQKAFKVKAFHQCQLSKL